MLPAVPCTFLLTQHLRPSDQHRPVPVSPQISTLESELTQLMKQNGVQVNNNNSNSTERLNAQQHTPRRGMEGGGGSALECQGILQIFRKKKKGTQ